MKSRDLHTISELKEIHVEKDIKLRLLKESDATRILEILADDNSIRDKVTVASRLYTPEDVVTEVDRYTKDIGLIRYVLVKDDNPIGLVSLLRDGGYFGTTPNPDDYGFGYFLDPKERGKGLISRSLRSLMKTVTKNLNVRQFIAFCEDSNHQSIALLTKLGFQPTDETFSEPNNGWIERKYIKAK